jgi:hypothetical protein
LSVRRQILSTPAIFKIAVARNILYTVQFDYFIVAVDLEKVAGEVLRGKEKR